MRPQFVQRRRWTHAPPISRQSSHPATLSGTSAYSIVSRCVQVVTGGPYTHGLRFPPRAVRCVPARVMTLSIPVVWSDAHRLHQPEAAVWVGVSIAGDELPQRAIAIRAAPRTMGGMIGNVTVRKAPSGLAPRSRALSTIR